MDGYLSFNVSFYFRTFNYCLKINWGHTIEEKRKKKKNHLYYGKHNICQAFKI